MLRRDNNAAFYRTGTIFKKYFFHVGGSPVYRRGAPYLKTTAYVALREDQLCQPVPVADMGNGRQYWMFEGNFYWTTETLDARDVLALVRERERNAQRKLERARTLLEVDDSPRLHRQSITREMRRAVYERDGGRCVECGSTFDLQYDHVIPVVMGGASTVDNLQLLCSRCNRDKGGSL